MKIGSGGSVVGSAQITDGAIVNADINNAAAIAHSKLGLSPNDDTGVISIATGTSLPYSLTTVANQRVVVEVRFTAVVDFGAGSDTFNLQYGGVTKDTITLGFGGGASGRQICGVLRYTAVPGAATANVTITSGVYTPVDISVTVIKIKGS